MIMRFGEIHSVAAGYSIVCFRVCVLYLRNRDQYCFVMRVLARRIECYGTPTVLACVEGRHLQVCEGGLGVFAHTLYSRGYVTQFRNAALYKTFLMPDPWVFSISK